MFSTIDFFEIKNYSAHIPICRSAFTILARYRSFISPGFRFHLFLKIFRFICLLLLCRVLTCFLFCRLAYRKAKWALV